MTRKADIRNCLSSILVDDILKTEAYKQYLNEGEESNANLLEKNTISHKFDTKLKLKFNSNEGNNCTGTITKREKGNNENSIVYIVVAVVIASMWDRITPTS